MSSRLETVVFEVKDMDAFMKHIVPLQKEDASAPFVVRTIAVNDQDAWADQAEALLHESATATFDEDLQDKIEDLVSNRYK